MKITKFILAIWAVLILVIVSGCSKHETTVSITESTMISTETLSTKIETSDDSKTTKSEIASSVEADKISAEIDELAKEGVFKELKIGFIPQSLSNEFYVLMYEGMLARAEKLGVTINAQSPNSQQNVGEQLVCAENLISSGCDALIMSPIGSRGLLTAVQLCEEKDIVMVAADQGFDNSFLIENGLKPIPYVGTNNFSAGQELGAWAKSHYPQGTKLALLRGTDGAQPNSDRYDGFFSENGAGPDYFDVVFEQNCDWETELGYQAMQNCIIANPDVKLVFAFCDTIGIGAYRAIQDANLGTKIDIMGLDGISEGIKMVYKGEFVVDIAQYPYNMGAYALDYALYLYCGKDVPMNTDAGVAVLDTESGALEYANSVGIDVSGWNN